MSMCLDPATCKRVNFRHSPLANHFGIYRSGYTVIHWPRQLRASPQVLAKALSVFFNVSPATIAVHTSRGSGAVSELYGGHGEI